MNRLLTQSLAIVLLVSGLAFLPACNGARDTALVAVRDGSTGFMIKDMTRGNRHRKYGLFVPTTYNKSQAYPVIIFLHGVGEGGNDARANLRVGLAPFVADRMSEFPFICLFPQSDNGGWGENSENAADIFTQLDDVSKLYNIDQDRVSLTGLSTGGYGTWAIGATRKDRFAALVPMGSSENPNHFAEALVDMPIWSFHNSGDIFAAPWNDSTMVSKLQALGNKNCKYTQYDAGGHDCWETAYGDGELFAWMLQQRRHATAAAPFGTPKQTSSRSTSASPVATPATPSHVQTNTGTSTKTPY